jgi:two-component system OmpR family sensor kinase
MVQTWDGRGLPIGTSSPGLVIPRLAAPGFADVTAAGDRWRSFLTVRGDRSVQVNQRHAMREWNAILAAVEAALPILVTITLGWVLIGWGLGRVLGSLRGLAAEIGARGVGSNRPIPLRDVPIEVAPLVDAMNALIERLHKSLDQQRNFLSDAAHELRTPLTALRLQIENVRGQGAASTLEATLPELQRGILRASGLVDQLLRMACYDTGATIAAHEAVDLVTLVLACIADHVVVAENKKVDLGVVTAEPLSIAGAPQDLRILFGNLIENAVRYTPPGGVVDVGIRRDGGKAVVEIIDTGCGIRDDLLARVFDRFFRAAPADIEGSGLGLAICRSICVRHGLDITLRNREHGQGLIATVTANIVA